MFYVLCVNVNSIEGPFLAPNAIQWSTQPPPVVMPMPYNVWHTLMTPVLTTEEGGEWFCTSKNETLIVHKIGLAQLDFLFGCDQENWYTWKKVRFGLGTLQFVDQIVFSYSLISGILKITARHKKDLSTPRPRVNDA